MLRNATREDVASVHALIDASVRGLNHGRYSPEEVEASLVHVFGVDTQLIDDGTYFVIERGGELAAAGGWSKRKTLFGGDQFKAQADPLLDPREDAARIRAFFVHPAHARRGLARSLFERCRDDARAEGFGRLALAATLPGVPLYETLGFVAHHEIPVPMPGGLTLTCIHMERAI